MEILKKKYKICFLYKDTWGIKTHRCRLKFAKKELAYEVEDFNSKFAYIRTGNIVYIPSMFKTAWLPEIKNEIRRAEGNVRFIFY